MSAVYCDNCNTPGSSNDERGYTVSGGWLCHDCRPAPEGFNYPGLHDPADDGEEVDVIIIEHCNTILDDGDTLLGVYDNSPEVN